MATFTAEILAFPTAVFTIILALSLLYWIASMFGLDGGDGADSLSGATDAAEALHGGTEEALFGGDAVEAGDGSAAGQAADVATLAVDAKDDARPKSGAVRPRVPGPLRLSAFALCSWVSSFLLMHHLAPAEPGVLFMSAVGLAAGGIGLAGGRLLVRPLAGLFAEAPPIRSQHMVGRICEVTTGRVDEGFGQGTIEDGGAGLVIAIRCEPGQLQRGDRALVLDYDAVESTYRVQPLANYMDEGGTVEL